MISNIRRTLTLEVAVKEEALGMLCCVVLVALPIGLLIGAVILRAAVHFANKVLPRPVERDYDEWDDYDRPRRASASAIPDPALGKAMGIVFVRFIVGFVVGAVIGFVMGVGAVGMGGGRPDPGLQVLSTLIQLPIGFLINAGILTPMLPTTFPRACLVVLFEYLISIAIGLIIAVPLVILLVAAGGMR